MMTKYNPRMILKIFDRESISRSPTSLKIGNATFLYVFHTINGIHSTLIVSVVSVVSIVSIVSIHSIHSFYCIYSIHSIATVKLTVMRSNRIFESRLKEK